MVIPSAPIMSNVSVVQLRFDTLSPARWRKPLMACSWSWGWPLSLFTCSRALALVWRVLRVHTASWKTSIMLQLDLKDFMPSQTPAHGARHQVYIQYRFMTRNTYAGSKYSENSQISMWSSSLYKLRLYCSFTNSTELLNSFIIFSQCLARISGTTIILQLTNEN